MGVYTQVFTALILLPKVCLRFTYFDKIELFLLKVRWIKTKINWNSTVRLMNSIKKYNKAHK